MSRRPAVEPRSRINLELSASLREDVEQLQKETHADSMLYVIRRAIIVYKTLVREAQKGNEVVIRGAGSEQKLLLAET